MNNGHRTPRTRFSPTVGGVVAVAAGALMALSSSSARAAVGSEASGVSDHELIEMGERVAEGRRAAARMLAEGFGHVLGRSADRASAAKEHLELWVTWGYGFEGLTMLDASDFEAPEASSEADDDRADEGRTRPRLDLSFDTNDPLAGL